MSLTTEQFSAVILGLKRTENAQPNGPNRRCYARINQLGWAEIASVNQTAVSEPLDAKVAGDQPTVTIHDISAVGVGFTIDRPIQPDSEFTLTLKRPNLPPLPVVYRVVNSRMVSADLYSVGGQLVRLLELKK